MAGMAWSTERALGLQEGRNRSFIIMGTGGSGAGYRHFGYPVPFLMGQCGSAGLFSALEDVVRFVQYFFADSDEGIDGNTGVW